MFDAPHTNRVSSPDHIQGQALSAAKQLVNAPRCFAALRMTACLLKIVTCACGLSLFSQNASAQPDPGKVLRYAIEVAETSMDPQKVSDVYSSILNNAVFDTPLRYDMLARPPKLIPNTLVAMPEVSADFRTLILRVKPGIFFDNHEAFAGK